MKNSSQTQHCRSKTRRKEEQKVKKNGALRNFVPTALFPAPTLFLLLPVPSFYAMPCLLLLLVFFPFYPYNSLSILVFLCNFPYTEHLYKPRSVRTLYQSTSINKVTGESSCSPSWLLLPLLCFNFLHVLFYFLGSQTPSEDDNSEDGWLKPFPP